MSVKNDSEVKAWALGQFLALPTISECDTWQGNLLSIKLCFLIYEMEMIAYLLCRVVVRIRQDNASKSTSGCRTASD